MVSLHAIILLSIATAAICLPFDLKVDDFGVDNNFGSGSTNFKCVGSCKTSEDCCDGYKCKRFFYGSKYGYCAKHCYPVGPGQDCRRCHMCTTGYICTILLTNEYICLENSKRSSSRH